MGLVFNVHWRILTFARERPVDIGQILVSPACTCKSLASLNLDANGRSANWRDKCKFFGTSTRFSLRYHFLHTGLVEHSSIHSNTPRQTLRNTCNSVWKIVASCKKSCCRSHHCFANTDWKLNLIKEFTIMISHLPRTYVDKKFYFATEAPSHSCLRSRMKWRMHWYLVGRLSLCRTSEDSLLN